MKSNTRTTTHFSVHSSRLLGSAYVAIRTDPIPGAIEASIAWRSQAEKTSKKKEMGVAQNRGRTPSWMDFYRKPSGNPNFERKNTVHLLLQWVLLFQRTPRVQEPPQRSHHMMPLLPLRIRIQQLTIWTDSLGSPSRFNQSF